MVHATHTDGEPIESGAAAIVRSAWTCPFCALHCDGFAVDVGQSLALVGSDCPKARAGLAHFSGTPSNAPARIDGEAATFEQALDAAAALLAQARQPLIAGLATDVAGARAAFRLAETTGAIVDHVHGTPLMNAVRSIQDRGTYYTTLAEIRGRADVLVCVGTTPSERYPEFFSRCGIVERWRAEPKTRLVVFLGTPVDPALDAAPGVHTRAVPIVGDPYETIAALAATASGRALCGDIGDLADLAGWLREARYAVIVWEPARLGEHGALAAEAINTLVAALNRTTRAASFALGGSDGAYSANQAFTWLSGLPLRTGLHPHRLAHEPVRYSSERLLRDASVDALVWIASFTPQPLPTCAPRRTMILAHPAAAALPEACAPGTIFVPVSTPGIGSRGHLFRMDGGVALPLDALYPDTLPTVARVLDDVTARLRPRAGPEPST